MTPTRSAVDQHAVTELVLWANNDAAVYRQIEAVAKNMQRKLARGQYNHALAVKGWRYVADAAAQSYTREFGDRRGSSYGIFGVAERNAAAAELARDFEAASRWQTGGLKPTGREGRYQPVSGTWMFS